MYTITMPILKRYDKDFFKTWSSDMAYVLGFLYADGNIVQTKRGTHFVAIYSADKNILVGMRNCFQSDHKISQRKSLTGCVYRIQIGSKEWFLDVNRLGLSPNKAKRMKLPDIPKNFFNDFLRGYFDGDGNVWVGLINKRRKTPTRIIQVAFTSGSHKYLVDLRRVIQLYGIEGGGLYVPKNGNFARLVFSSKDALKLAEIMYNGQPKLYLKRKKLRFDQFRSKRTAKIPH